MASSADSAVPAETMSPADRRTMIGGVMTLFLDSYDIYLPAFVLPVVMGYFEPASMSPAMKVTLVGLIFTATLLGRPLGSPIFGHFSDKIGRKRLTMIVASGYSIMTFLIAIMPGYAAWGYAPIYLLVLLRFLDGMFIGGGYSAPIPYAMERSPRRLRAFLSGVVASAAAFAFFVINLAQLVVLSNVHGAALLNWGWRLPFFFGVLMGIGYLVYYARIPEIEMKYLESKDKRPRQPLIEVFSGPNLPILVQVFLLSVGYWLAAQMPVSFFPALVIGILHQSPKAVSAMYLYSTPFSVAAMILIGMLAEKVGRRRLLLWAGVGTAVFTTLCFYLMVPLAHAHASFVWIFLLWFIANTMISGPLGVFMVYLNERFPVQIRSTGFGMSYAFGMIFPAFYSVWLLLLSHIMPFAYTPTVLTFIGGVVVLFAALAGPETRNVRMLEQTVSD